MSRERRRKRDERRKTQAMVAWFREQDLPAPLPESQGRRRLRLSPRQTALYCLLINREKDGTTELSTASMAGLLGVDVRTIRSALTALEGRGLVELNPKGKAVQVFRPSTRPASRSGSTLLARPRLPAQKGRLASAWRRCAHAQTRFCNPRRVRTPTVLRSPRKRNRTRQNTKRGRPHSIISRRKIRMITGRKTNKLERWKLGGEPQNRIPGSDLPVQPGPAVSLDRVSPSCYAKSSSET
jgi:hypothetical protein